MHSGRCTTEHTHTHPRPHKQQVAQPEKAAQHISHRTSRAWDRTACPPNRMRTNSTTNLLYLPSVPLLPLAALVLVAPNVLLVQTVLVSIALCRGDGGRCRGGVPRRGGPGGGQPGAERHRARGRRVLAGGVDWKQETQWRVYFQLTLKADLLDLAAEVQLQL